MTAAFRDSLVICGNVEAAQRARAEWPTLEVCTIGCGTKGFESIPDVTALAQRWGRLTKRCPSVTVLEVPERVNEAVRQLCTATAANLETTVSRGRKWVEHTAVNLWRLCWDAPGQAVRGCLKGTAAIIVGAGPSLDRNFEDIERFRKHALIMGVNSATLAVECDVHVCIEANDLRQKLSTRPAIRCFGLAVPPDVMAHGDGKLAPVWNGDLSRLVEGMTGMRRLSTSASGTTAAVSLALLWGCDPIVLVGQDLAFSGGQVYSERTGFGGAVMLDEGLLRMAWSDAAKELPRTTALPEVCHPMQVPAWGGEGEVASTPGLAVVRGWLSDIARRKLVQCINATEGGAHVHGWADVPLSKIGVKQREIPPGRYLRNQLGVTAPVLGPKRLRVWRDDQVSGLQTIADLAVRIPNMAGRRHIEAARLLAEGISTVPMLEPWLAQELTPLAMARQCGRPESVDREVALARDDLDTVAAIVARGALELSEVLEGQAYGGDCHELSRLRFRDEPEES
jgi:hypothetical protein